MSSGVASWAWNGPVRFVVFVVPLAVVAWTTMALLSPLSADAFLAIFGEAVHGTFDRVSTPGFAFTLALAIGALAGGLLVAHGLAHALAVRLSIRSARRRVERVESMAAFARDFDELRDDLARHPLLGHAWSEFAETLVHHRDQLQNTFRPSAFFSMAMLREKLAGLKWMPTEPGYFVGTGLLLTFIGLVIALSKAAAGTEAATAGEGAVAMQAALRELLHAATFKFATSIAGLAASIVLSMVYRAYTIGIEHSLHAFCEAVENKLGYIPPQAVSLEMRDRLEDQLTELKTINSGEFFARLGSEMAPHLHRAFVSAMDPLTSRINDAVGEISAGSQNGVDELIARFSASLDHGAGAQMREVTAGLQSVLAAVEKVRDDMGGSGEDFARRMTGASENLERMMAEAARHLGTQSETSRETLGQMVVALQELFDRASRQVDEKLAGAAEGASDRLTQAMDRVLDRLETQVGGLAQSFEGFRENASSYVSQTRATIDEAQKTSVATITEASNRTAVALEQGLGAALKDIRGQIEAFVAALRQSAAALEGQARAIDGAALRSRETADVFGRSAEAMRAAVEPVTRSNERVAAITTSVGSALEKATATLGDSQKAASTLGTAITAQVERLTRLWTDYQQRFGVVDEQLGRAFAKLAEETTKQSQILADRTSQIDGKLAEAVDRLGASISEIGEGAGELAESVEALQKLMAQRSTLR